MNMRDLTKGLLLSVAIHDGAVVCLIMKLPTVIDRQEYLFFCYPAACRGLFIEIVYEDFLPIPVMYMLWQMSMLKRKMAQNM